MEHSNRLDMFYFKFKKRENHVQDTLNVQIRSDHSAVNVKKDLNLKIMNASVSDNA